MNTSEAQGSQSRERLKAWAVVLAIVAFILVYGFLVYRIVGDRGPPGWDFGAVPDVPGESPYATERLK